MNNMDEVTQALNVLVKYRIEVFFLYKESSVYFQVSKKRNWRIYSVENQVVSQRRGTPPFIRYRCQKLLLKI